MKKTVILAIAFLSGLILFNACKKKYDTPPLKTPNDGAKLYVSQIKARATAVGSYHFAQGDTNLYCTIIADETSGNIYKQVFAQDDNGGAIQLNLVATGGLYVGDKVRINLNRLYAINANSMVYIDSVDVGKNVVKLSSGNAVTPKVVTLAAILAGTSPTNTNSLQSQLVQIDNAEFFPSSQNVPFADAISKSSVNLYIKTCASPTSSLTVRSSGYANFASKNTPTGNGSIIAVVTQYNSTMQLTIRNYNEVSMNGPVCGTTSTTTGTYLSKDFQDNSLVTGNWDTVIVIGTLKWTTSTFSGSTYAKVSGYSGGNKNTEIWLISPPVDLSSATNPNLYFKTAAATFAGNPLEVVVSTNYTSGLPSTASWVNLSATLSPTTTSYVWTPSGTVSLSGYKTPNTRIAFKYTSTTSAAATYEVDDIVIKEN